MSENNSEANNHNIYSDQDNTKIIEPKNDSEVMDQSQSLDSYPKWINNKGEEVKQVLVSMKMLNLLTPESL